MNIVKHLDIFDPSKHADPIAVIGAGAVGSVVTLQLCKLGLNNINIYDFDTVSEHNIPNQLLYGNDHIGKYKATILTKTCKELTNITNCRSNLSKIDKSFKLTEKTVILCVDSMAARREIYENCLFLNGFTDLCLDTRINAFSGRINIWNPCIVPQHKMYLSTLYSDDEVDASKGNCGLTLSMGATASLAANYAIWMFVDWVMQVNREIFEMQFMVRPQFKQQTTSFNQMANFMDLEEESS